MVQGKLILNRPGRDLPENNSRLVASSNDLMMGLKPFLCSFNTIFDGYHLLISLLERMHEAIIQSNSKMGNYRNTRQQTGYFHKN